MCGSSGNKKNLLVYIYIYIYNMSENKKSLLVYIYIYIYIYIIYFLSNFTCYRVFATVGQVYLQRTGPSPS